MSSPVSGRSALLTARLRLYRTATLAAALIGFTRAAAAQGGTGRLEGVATIASVLKARHSRIRLYDDPATPPPRPADDNAIAGVVIALDGNDALQRTAGPAPQLSPVMRQRDQTFVPHVLPIVVGTTVEFPNDDPLFHDVFSLSAVKTFDLERYPRGESRQVTFSRSGVVQVFCHIHADMSGYIVVLNNPFFVIPDSSGHFALNGIPAGDYRLTAWQERAHLVTVHVHVEAGRTSHADVRIPIVMP
ncbi:MAG: hypothetical protein ACREL5_09595 [Gemmatimonadales bacterium]